VKGCRSAVLSVYDRRGVVELGRALAEMKVEILSTGGTARLLRENKVPLREVSEVTGFPEMLGGRVKTLHPAIHAGILARRDDPEHMAALAKQGFRPIDLVVVNLYPFAQTAARAEATPAELIEEIDVGGPTMLRAAAKNFDGVAVVVSPDDYPRVAEELKASGTLSLSTRLELARKAFAVTATYDSTIARTLDEFQADGEASLSRAAARDFPAVLALAGRKAMDLRSGENPHQRPALYQSDGGAGIAGARKLQGKELSYNNLLDLDAAWDLANEFDEPVTAATAEAISKLFVECVAAPGYEPAALEILGKKKNLRVMEIPPEKADPSTSLGMTSVEGWRVRSIAGGWLVQDKDCGQLNPKELRTATKRAPTAAELEQLLFAWVVCKHTKSNAIVYLPDSPTIH